MTKSQDETRATVSMAHAGQATGGSLGRRRMEATRFIRRQLCFFPREELSRTKGGPRTLSRGDPVPRYSIV